MDEDRSTFDRIIKSNLTSFALSTIMMSIAGRLDMENPDTIEKIQYVYGASLLIQLGILWWIYNAITKKNDRTPLTYVEPANEWLQEPAKTHNTTNYEYDVGQLGTVMRQSAITVLITLALYLRGGYVRPMVLQTLLPIKTLLASPLFDLHGQGKSATGPLKRPWIPQNPFNFNPGAAPPQAVSEKELKRIAKKEAKTK